MIYFLISSVIIFLLGNMYSLNRLYALPLICPILLAIAFGVIQLRPSASDREIPSMRLRNSERGCVLLRMFLVSSAFTCIYSVVGWVGLFPIASLKEDWKLWVINTAIAFVTEAIVFWNGIIRIYITSGQLAIRRRVLGAVCGWIPIVNLIVLIHMISVVESEVEFEGRKIRLDQSRADEQICKTKYPLIMVHGVFFRDYQYVNYWGRIPKALQQNGAVVYYGNHASAASVESSAEELTKRIRQIVAETGCEKVNLIAHSKGGLDCRYALAKCGAAPYVASLTTINSPHRGCEFADYLLKKIPQKHQNAVADTYNAALREIGELNPDFLAAVYDLTAEECAKRNENITDAEGVYYQSVGSRLNRASHGRFPLNLTNRFVKYFDGPNDGLVGEESFPWGQDYRLLTVKGRRGISHGDVIDLNRENIPEFDVREFYVQLVHDLKEKGF